VFVGIMAVVAAAAACGTPTAAHSSAPIPRVSAPDANANCPKIFCDPNHDYGQPSLGALREAEVQNAAARPPAQVATGSTVVNSSTGSSGGQTTSSGASTSGTAVTGVPGAAGPAGPAGAAGPAGPPGAASADFAAVYTKYKDSIARFTVLDCSTRGTAVGSGFVVGPDLVATAAHVVSGMRILQLTVADKVVTGHVIGVDDSRDVALLRLDRTVAVASVPLATEWPDVGSPLGVMGYALGGPLSMQQGHVSAVNITYNGRPGFIETDTAEDHGSSGGAVLDATGHAVAIVSMTLGTSAGLVKLHAGSLGAAKLFTSWTKTPQHVSSC
jgi:S1-C subfamily serine protease